MQPTEPTNVINPVQPQPTEPPPSHKKTIAILVLLLVAVTLVGILVTQNTNTGKTSDQKISKPVADTAIISITNTGFSPETITVKAGQSVEWTNKDSTPHQISSDPHPKDDALAGLNDESSLATDESYSYIFEQAGTFTYHDELRPLEFKGTVIVE